AVVDKNFWLLVVAVVIAGYYSANGQLYRFAAAELAAPAFRERAISIVLAGGTLRRTPAQQGDEPVNVGEAAVVLGRDPCCTLVLRDPRVSALHAELVATADGVRLKDLGSRNGTYISGVRVNDCFLSRACTIECGDSSVSFEPLHPTDTKVTISDSFGPLVGGSRPMIELFERLRKVAPTDLSVLILGETGTGKELVAQALHQASKRADGPFVVIDCSSIAPTLAEAVLFGHERGAFTGADTARRSPFLEANGGTVFLDEVGELPLEIQPKLLRALGERRIKPVGARDYKSFDVRVISATRRNLVQEVNSESFRSDLFFRLAQLRVDVPALRARAPDIPRLIQHILAQTDRNAASLRIDADQMERLMRYDWPGNVRELKNAVWTAVYLAEGDELDVASHLFSSSPSPSGLVPYHQAKKLVLDQFTSGYFARLATLTSGKISEMARLAEIERAHVRKYLRAHGLDRPRGSRRAQKSGAKDEKESA
ncbi:MAG: sigma 54-interacting transcriptional regulator, partial [Byssovorax sp.]